MPTYEYQCENCGHRFEKFQSIKAPAIRKCPECGKNTVKRLLGTGAGIIFKGSGFYTTDYRSESYKSDAKSDSGGGSSSETKTDAKSDAKTESKTESKSDAKTDSKHAATTESKPAPKTEPKSSKK